MPVTEPVLTKRIPTDPWGNPSDRHTVSYDEYVKTGGYQALEKALDMDPAAIVNEVKESQLRGRGGAGFPCGLKWTFLPEPDGGRRYLCINCDEAEPGTFKDRLLVDFDPHLVLEGIAISCYACQLDTAYFFIRGEYWHHQAKVDAEAAIRGSVRQRAFSERKVCSAVRASSRSSAICIAALARISAAKKPACIEAVEGKRGWPRVKPPFPAVKGLFGRPTIVNNVETLAAVGPIVDERRRIGGKAWAANRRSARPASYGPKLMGVSGHVNKPALFRSAISVFRLSTLVNDFCRRDARRKEIQRRDRRRRVDGHPRSRSVRRRDGL